MASEAVGPGRVVRQTTRFLIQTPKREAYLYLADVRDLLTGDLDPNVELLDRQGADVGRVSLSHDMSRLYLDLRGAGRYQMWLSHVKGLLRGQRTEAPLRVLAEPGDPTHPVYYLRAGVPS